MTESFPEEKSRPDQSREQSPTARRFAVAAVLSPLLYLLLLFLAQSFEKTAGAFQIAFFALPILVVGGCLWFWFRSPPTTKTDPTRLLLWVGMLINGLALAFAISLTFLPIGDADWRAEANDAAAMNAGNNARIVQRLYFQNRGRYAENLEELCVFDQFLAEDPDITFVFGTVEQSGYTFTTVHAKGQIQFVFSPEGEMP